MKIKIIEENSAYTDDVPSLQYNGSITIYDTSTSSVGGDRIVTVSATRTDGCNYEYEVCVPVEMHPAMAIDKEKLDYFFDVKKKRVIIGLHGKARAGKDTVADMVGGLTRLTVEKIALAKPIKEIASILFNMSQEEIEQKKEEPAWFGVSPRKFLQEFGTNFVREKYGDDFWIKHLEKKIDSSKADIIVVTDVRFENEVDFIESLPDGVVIKIKRDQTIQGESAQHASEAFTARDEDVDYVIDNNASIQELEDKVNDILKEILT